MNNDSILRSLSMRARLAYEESYSDQIALPKWDKLLEELGEGDRLQ